MSLQKARLTSLADKLYGDPTPKSEKSSGKKKVGKSYKPKKK